MPGWLDEVIEMAATAVGRAMSGLMAPRLTWVGQRATAAGRHVWGLTTPKNTLAGLTTLLILNGIAALGHAGLDAYLAFNGSLAAMAFYHYLGRPKIPAFVMKAVWVLTMAVALAVPAIVLPELFRYVEPLSRPGAAALWVAVTYYLLLGGGMAYGRLTRNVAWAKSVRVQAALVVLGLAVMLIPGGLIYGTPAGWLAMATPILAVAMLIGTLTAVALIMLGGFHALRMALGAGLLATGKFLLCAARDPILLGAGVALVVKKLVALALRVLFDR